MDASGTRSPIALHLVCLFLAAALVALTGRLLAFQQSGQAEMTQRADRQQRIVLPKPARRGKIYGNSHAMLVQLAASRQVPSCFADPMFMNPEDIAPVAEAVADVLGLSAAAVRDQLDENRRAARRFVWLARGLDKPTADRVKALGLAGVGIIEEWRRYYPNGELAAHVVGFVGRDGRGLEGIELIADSHLSAVDGRKVVLGDAARRPIWDVPGGFTPPQDGRHVQLTLDVVVQRHLERVMGETVNRFGAESAVGVVVDPRSGDILALANVPTYDPNTFGQATQDQRRCRVVTDPYEPGSIFKPFVASVALALGKVRMGQEFFCHNGAYRCRPGRILHDAHPYGPLTFEQVVFKSSNIGMALIGEILKPPLLHRACMAFGFGAKTGIELTGEDPGLIHPLQRWTRDSKWSVPMGQEVSVTAVQMAMAFSVFANDGLLLRPKLIRKVHDTDGRVILDNTAARPVRRVIEPDVCRRFVRQVLARVPIDGTGRNHARLNGWSSFAKTGTAQIAPYSGGQFTASYIAAAPVERPRLVCVISVRKPNRAVGHYGGQVAGPAVKEVLEKSLAYLNVPRDADPD